MTTNEICQRLGEERFKAMVLELPPTTIKKILSEVGLKASKPLSKLGAKQRAQDWADRLWHSLSAPKTGAVVLYAWFGNCRNALLSQFLDSLEVKHQFGLTDEDFLNQLEESKLHAAAQKLLESGIYEKRDVATYLLFLDASNQSSRFASLGLEKHLNS